MPLPTNTSKEDVDAMVAFLRNKPVGITVDSAKATIEARLVDSRKLNAYRAWGFVTEDSGKLTLTKIGREYSQATEQEKRKYYTDIIRNENIYRLTVEWFYNRNFDQISATDVASHWFTHFRQDINSESERAITEQVTCFMSVSQAAGLGEYKIGRRGQPTRLEVNRSSIKEFLDKAEEGVENLTENDNDEVFNFPNAQVLPDGQIVPPVQTSPKNSQIPSLHIDIQIHIDSDATPEQIDKIFESMAKHLYKNNGD